MLQILNTDGKIKEALITATELNKCRIPCSKRSLDFLLELVLCSRWDPH